MAQRHMRKNYPRSPAPRPPTSTNVILITGGIGDFLAIDSYLDPTERYNIQRVVLATRAHRGISELIAANPEWRAVVHVPTFDWSKKFCFTMKDEAYMATKDKMVLSAVDYGINRIFPEIISNKRTFHYSSFCTNILCPSINVPTTRYIVICADSINNYGIVRSFTGQDWQDLCAFLEVTEQIGVILGVGSSTVPVHPRLLNQMNQTTLPQAIEVVKKASGYIGIDSSMSVIASKLFQYPDLIVKSNNTHLMQHKSEYYSPQTSYQFIVDDLSQLKRAWNL